MRIFCLLKCVGLPILLALVLLPAASVAQDVYPSRPVVLVVPYPPGGSGDVQARIIAAAMSRRLGQSVVVENRPGAGTAIGAAYVANAKADGYTLLLSSGSTFTLNPAVQSSLPYDPIKSFQPIGMISRVALVMLANTSVPLNSLEEVVTTLKTRPERFSYGSFGVGTSSHFASAIATHAMGIQLMHVPYRGSALAMKDLIGGQINFLFDTLTSAVPQIRAGRVKPLAVTSARRSPLLPDVPTFAESGYPEVVFDSWGMLVGPRGLAPQVLAKLEIALQGAIADHDVRQSLAVQGVEAMFAGPAQAAEYLEAELPLMRATAARANIRAE